MPRMKIGELNDLYNEAELVDKELFAEMRSNILLVSGDHYRKTSDRLLNRVRDSKAHSDSQKLRLVKNHTQRITSIYKNSVMNAAPGVRVFPYNQSELQDQKTAELNQSVWEDAVEQQKMREKNRKFVSSFIDIGEVACKIFWDPTKGKLIGFHQQLDENGEPMFKEDGSEVADEAQPVFSGEMVIEQILPFNLLRAPQAEDMDESPYLIVRKMKNIKEAKRLFPSEEKRKFIEESAHSTFKVFDGLTGSFRDTKDQVMFREYYFRPSVVYPMGYFYITTEKGVLSEGPLPFGIFPIRHKPNELIPTSPRGRSIIKHLRPYQAEINRSSSSIATAQVSLGDDRVFVLNGSKVSKGIQMPGVRIFNVSGQEPKIVPGRSGEQYANYLSTQIEEMYQIASLSEIQEAEKTPQTEDIYPLLFRSMKNKQKFSVISEKFEDFLVGVCKTYLELAKNYYSDDRVIRAAGRREAVNLDEFRNTNVEDIRIKVEPVAEDVDATMGRAMQLNTIMQFMGNDLPDEAKGEIIKLMPFINQEQIFSSLTIDYENIQSDMLALERGEFREVGLFDNHKEYIRRFTNRVKQKDFDQLAPEIQEMFKVKLQQHQAAESQQQLDLLEAQAGFIPTGGGLTKTDLYEPNPNSPEKQRRATFPVEALQWLKKRLEAQGLNQDQLETMQQQNLVEIAKNLPQTQTGEPVIAGPQPLPIIDGGI